MLSRFGRACAQERDQSKGSCVDPGVSAEEEPTTPVSTVIRFIGAFAGGGMTTLGLVNEILPVGIVGVALTLGFIILLPRRPWVLAGLGAGVVVTLAALTVTWVTTGSGWRCADEVAGEIIERDCGVPAATAE